ncbi:MAG: hypothetical protein GEU71_03530 [Actinobacteria bacterium]|nr:hypothetical protein [Actinomycetota bacterium]
MIALIVAPPLPPAQAIDVLQRARARIEDPARWTTCYLARDAQGEHCAPQSKEAVSWCALGALQTELRTLGERYDEIPRIWRLLQPSERFRSTTQVNDHEGHAAVLQLYADAIAYWERAS